VIVTALQEINSKIVLNVNCNRKHKADLMVICDHKLYMAHAISKTGGFGERGVAAYDG